MAIVAEGKGVDFKKDGSGSGQQGFGKAERGVNKYVLQYKLTDAAESAGRILAASLQ